MKLIQYSTVLSHLLYCCDALKATPRFRGLLFDIDGTLVNTDPIHFAVFRDLLLQDPNFNGGEPIDHTFFNTRISGRQNNLIQADLFPQRSAEEQINGLSYPKRSSIQRTFRSKYYGLEDSRA